MWVDVMRQADPYLYAGQPANTSIQQIPQNPGDLANVDAKGWPIQDFSVTVLRAQSNNLGTYKLSMNVATIPPGGVARAHVHVGFDVMLYILQGRVRHEYGPGLRKAIDNEAGDFIYIEPGVPHEVFNLSTTEPVVAVVARSDPSEWENIIPYDRHAEA